MPRAWPAPTASPTAPSRSCSRSPASGRQDIGGVKVAGVVEDPSPPKTVYDPKNPHADAEGYVTMPNVNVVEEMTNMISASRSYQANVEVLNTAKTLMVKTLTHRPVNPTPRKPPWPSPTPLPSPARTRPARGSTATASRSADSEQRFLKLLVTQLNNQDPLNPMENAELTSQLAQMSTVSGIEKLNSTLSGPGEPDRLQPGAAGGIADRLQRAVARQRARHRGAGGRQGPGGPCPSRCSCRARPPTSK